MGNEIFKWHLPLFSTKIPWLMVLGICTLAPAHRFKYFA